MIYHINIRYNNKILNLNVIADEERYQVFQRGILMGSIFPSIDSGFVYWSTADLMTAALVDTIGLEIEKQDL